jgi:hypothetical protein
MANVKRHGAVLKPSEIALLMAEASGWRPEKGDQLEGAVLGVKIGTSTFGDYPIVFVLNDTDDEPVAIHAFHTTLSNELRGQRPEMGDKLFVAYLGPKENYEGPKGYDPPEIYAAVVTKPTADKRSVWDAMPGRREETPPENSGKASGTFNDDPPF